MHRPIPAQCPIACYHPLDLVLEYPWGCFFWKARKWLRDISRHDRCPGDHVYPVLLPPGPVCSDWGIRGHVCVRSMRCQSVSYLCLLCALISAINFLRQCHSAHSHLTQKFERSEDGLKQQTLLTYTDLTDVLAYRLSDLLLEMSGICDQASYTVAWSVWISMKDPWLRLSQTRPSHSISSGKTVHLGLVLLLSSNLLQIQLEPQPSPSPQISKSGYIYILLRAMYYRSTDRRQDAALAGSHLQVRSKTIVEKKLGKTILRHL